MLSDECSDERAELTEQGGIYGVCSGDRSTTLYNMALGVQHNERAYLQS